MEFHENAEYTMNAFNPSSVIFRCYMDFEQECVDGRCRCKGGLRTLTDEDKKAVYPDTVQCRNKSHENGNQAKY